MGDHRPSSRRSSYCTAEAAAIVTAVITANDDSQPLEVTRARTIWAKECWAKEFNLLSVPIPLPPHSLADSRILVAVRGNESGKARSKKSGHGNRAMFPSRFSSGTGETRPIAHGEQGQRSQRSRMRWRTNPAETRDGEKLNRPDRWIVPRLKRPGTND